MPYPRLSGDYSTYAPYVPRLNPEQVISAYTAPRLRSREFELEQMMGDRERRWAMEEEQATPQYQLNQLKLRDYPQDRALQQRLDESLISQRTAPDLRNIDPNSPEGIAAREDYFNRTSGKVARERLGQQRPKVPRLNQWTAKAEFDALPEVQLTRKLQGRRRTLIDQMIEQQKLAPEKVDRASLDNIVRAYNQDLDNLEIAWARFLQEKSGGFDLSEQAAPTLAEPTTDDILNDPEIRALLGL